MDFGIILMKILKMIGNILTLGLYQWLKKKYENKS